MKITLSLLAPVLGIFLLFASPATATDCSAEIARLNQTIAEVSGVHQGIIAEARAILNQASDLCNSGNEEGAQTFIKQVKSLVGVE